MTFKSYFIKTLLVNLFLILLFLGFNVFLNDYGLFGDAKGMSKKIVTNERTSKYLLSLNYIPANFNGLLIGSSVSDNLNTKLIKSFKIYNGSINGSNITERKLIADNVIQKGNLQILIICLHPYAVKDHGTKSSFMNPHEYWESLGSKATLELYRIKLKIRLGKELDYYNDYGYKNYNLKKKNLNVTRLIEKRVKEIKEKGSRIIFDEIAFAELEQLVNSALQNQVKVFAYFYPSPYDVFQVERKNHTVFENKIRRIFDGKGTIWNFNSKKYQYFTKNHENYCDQIHLSLKGALLMLKEIENKLIEAD